MSREAQLQFCKVCKHHKFDFNRGILCGLTNELADFVGTCPTYEEDTVLKESEQKRDAQKNLARKTVSRGTRFVNYFLDGLFLLAFSLGLFVLLGVIAGLTNTSFSLDENDLTILFYTIAFTLKVFYFTILESISGRSMAKFITRTKVVMEDGSKLTLSVALTRTLCRFIPFDALSFLGDDARGWHDTLSKTRVISVKDE